MKICTDPSRSLCGEEIHITFIVSASEMTYIVSSGALNSTHSLTHCRLVLAWGYAVI